MQIKEFYVYGYIRLDTNKYFYIGKGKGKRCYKKQGRNKHFMNILNSVPCAVEIIKDNLIESEAYALEEKIIDSLVFEEGYSIAISGFNNRGAEGHLTNKYWGGTGGGGGVPKPKHVVDNLKRINSMRSGEFNSSSIKIICLNTLKIYGSINLAIKETGITSIYSCCSGANKYSGVSEQGEKLVWMYYSDYLNLSQEEVRLKIELAQNSRQGEHNSFYGKSHSSETLKKLRDINLGRKQSEETKAKYDRWGEKNSMYGRKGELSPHYGKPKSEECKRKLSEANGTKIKCIELDVVFNSLNEAEREMYRLYNIKINRKTIVNRMKPNSKKNWCGEINLNGECIKLHWEYIK